MIWRFCSLQCSTVSECPVQMRCNMKLEVDKRNAGCKINTQFTQESYLYKEDGNECIVWLAVTDLVLALLLQKARSYRRPWKGNRPAMNEFESAPIDMSYDITCMYINNIDHLTDSWMILLEPALCSEWNVFWWSELNVESMDSNWISHHRRNRKLSNGRPWEVPSAIILPIDARHWELQQ